MGVGAGATPPPAGAGCGAGAGAAPHPSHAGAGAAQSSQCDFFLNFARSRSRMLTRGAWQSLHGGGSQQAGAGGGGGGGGGGGAGGAQLSHAGAASHPHFALRLCIRDFSFSKKPTREQLTSQPLSTGPQSPHPAGAACPTWTTGGGGGAGCPAVAAVAIRRIAAFTGADSSRGESGGGAAGRPRARHRRPGLSADAPFASSRSGKNLTEAKRIDEVRCRPRPGGAGDGSRAAWVATPVAEELTAAPPAPAGVGPRTRGWACRSGGHPF